MSDFAVDFAVPGDFLVSIFLDEAASDLRRRIYPGLDENVTQGES